MDTVTPIVSTDMPTRRLMLALEEAGWVVSRILGARALLRSPDREHAIIIRVDVDQPDRVVEVKLGPGKRPIDKAAEGARPVDIAEATAFVKANGAT